MPLFGGERAEEQDGESPAKQRLKRRWGSNWSTSAFIQCILGICVRLCLREKNGSAAYKTDIMPVAQRLSFPAEETVAQEGWGRG